jgi:hypothetical protein
VLADGARCLQFRVRADRLPSRFPAAIAEARLFPFVDRAGYSGELTLSIAICFRRFPSAPGVALAAEECGDLCVMLCVVCGRVWRMSVCARVGALPRACFGLNTLDYTMSLALPLCLSFTSAAPSRVGVFSRLGA